jgi:class 3 adenylate cyclase/tetratricopeptide (TPR) repeat protein
VIVCPNCGEENPERFRLCGFCGTALTAALPPQEVRKTVTIVFSDLQGSTALGERLDSEALREVMSRYFDEMRGALELHGGTIEKYIGDAIMAVFGLPVVHEDDAIRAVRAAAQMKQTLATLNDELERRWGARLTNRTGVNTGEVVAGDPALGQRLVTGDAVNVAARLEQAAPPLEILIGEPTYRLVRDAVEVEAVDPLELKGKSERIPAYRLISAKRIDEVERQHRSELVGRSEELRILQSAFERAVAERHSRLALVEADAGVGKSRLIEEFTRSVDGEAMVLRGRCLPYGRGITFWPLGEIVREAAGIKEDDQPDEAYRRLLDVVGEKDVVDRIGSAIGFVPQQFPVEDVFWATRRLLENLALRGPVVVVFEDIHWAESTFLALIERVTSTLREAPVFLLCATRPLLYEIRPGGLDVEGAEKIELRPLSEDESGLVVESLLGHAVIDVGVKHRIIQAAEGNPLYVEQMLSMLIDDGVLRREDGRWIPTVDLAEITIPPTIQALLSARLDLLSREERAVIEPASVIGLVFAQAAIEELVPDAITEQVPASLLDLSTKGLVRSDSSESDLGAFFRFDHILIRDAAYQGLLKRARATLHERFADWGERVNRDRDRGTEYEEISGYHLEQAYGYLAELGPVDEHGRGLAVRASEKLAAAGRRAFARDDMPAAANLLRRAAELLTAGDPARVRLLPDLGEALIEIGELAWAEVYLEEAVETAATTRSEATGADATLVRLLARRYGGGDLTDWSEEVLREARRAVPIFENAGDHRALARAWRLTFGAHGSAYRLGESAIAAARAAEHARLAEDGRQEARAASAAAMAAVYGPTPIPEALARCEQALTQTVHDRRAHGLVLCVMAPLKAMQGEFDAARELYVRARAMLQDAGGTLVVASTSLDSSTVEMLAGDPVAAEQELRRDYATLERMGETYLRPTVAAYLARALYVQGRHDEAVDFVQVAEEVAAEDDVISQALWRSAKAAILVRDDRLDEAEVLAREAVELLDRTDGLVKRADALVVLAAILRRAGADEESQKTMREALAFYERKGTQIAEKAARAAFSDLAGAPLPERTPA